MEFPIHPAAHTFVPSPPLSPLDFHNQAYKYAGHPGFPCQRCIDYANSIASLRIHVAMLDEQLLKAKKERIHAERLARHLLARNEAAMSEATAIDTAGRDDFELRRSLIQANAEKDCLKIMLERAWKKVADLSVSATSNPGSKPSPVSDHLKDTEDLLLDLLGPSELPHTGHSVKGFSSLMKPDELNEVEETKSITSPADSEEFEDLVQEDTKLEPDDDLSDHYIFHFVREHKNSKGSRDEDEIIMMREEALNRSTQNAICGSFSKSIDESVSDNLAAIHSVPCSPIAKGEILTKRRSIRSTPKWPFKYASIWSFDAPTISSDSIPTPSTGQRETAETAEPAIEFKDQHKSVADASSGSIEYPIRLYDSRQELEDAILNHKKWESPRNRKLPEFFEHGLHFNPSPGAKNIFRTLVISDLPQSVTMTELLNKIRGGVVVDAKLLDTFNITGGKTALVTFLHERDARALQTHLTQHPFAIDNRVAHVTVLETPTWPIPRVSERALLDGKETRCLEVSRYPRYISPHSLRRHLCLCSVRKVDRIEHTNLRDDDGVLALRFESTACAADARGVLTSHRAFRGCNVRFAPDPCAQPFARRDDEIKEHSLRLWA